MAESPNSERSKDSIRTLKTTYYSEVDNLTSDFFTPCLGCFSNYDRAAGYFSSSALRSWASAMRNLVDSPEAAIKLLISPELPEDDVQALKSVVDDCARAKLLKRDADAFVERALLWSEAGDLDNRDCAALRSICPTGRNLEFFTKKSASLLFHGAIRSPSPDQRMNRGRLIQLIPNPLMSFDLGTPQTPRDWLTRSRNFRCVGRLGPTS